MVSLKNPPLLFAHAEEYKNLGENQQGHHEACGIEYG